MKQVAQKPRDGVISVLDVPQPTLRPGWILVANPEVFTYQRGYGTKQDRFGGKSLVGKARARPDLVKKVVERARVEGVRAAASAARDG